MTRQELLDCIKDKKKGKLIDVRQQAIMMDPILELAEEIRAKIKTLDQLNNELAQDKAVISDIYTHFPVLYREAKRLFTHPKTQENEEY